MGIFSNLASAYVIYALLRRLTWNWDEWPAFKTGVIDDKGNILVKKQNRNLYQQDSFGMLDVLCWNMKRLLSKLPGGNSKFVTYAAALFLLKEEKITEANFKKFISEQNDLNIKVKLLMESTKEEAIESAKKSAVSTKEDWIVIETSNGSFYSTKKSVYDNTSEKVKSSYKTTIPILSKDNQKLTKYSVFFEFPDGYEGEYKTSAVSESGAKLNFQKFASTTPPYNKLTFKRVTLRK